jgi:hypothetical protein
VIGTSEFREVFNSALASVQQQLVAGKEVITLDLGAAADPILRQVTSGVPFADAILDAVLPSVQGVLTVTVITRQEAPELWNWVDRGQRAPVWSVVLLIVFLGLGVGLLTRHWIGVAAAGGVVVVGALISFVTGWGSRAALRSEFAPGLEQRTFEAVYREFAGAFAAQTFVMLAAGVAILVTGLVAELLVLRSGSRRSGAEGASSNGAASVTEPEAGVTVGGVPLAPTGPPTLAVDANRPGPPLLDD